jgi:hypothetical protein
VNGGGFPLTQVGADLRHSQIRWANSKHTIRMKTYDLLQEKAKCQQNRRAASEGSNKAGARMRMTIDECVMEEMQGERSKKGLSPRGSSDDTHPWLLEDDCLEIV